MRKRVVPARPGIIVAAVSFTLIIAACDRGSDTAREMSVDSTVPTDGAVPQRRALMRPEMAAAASAPAPPATEGRGSSAAANDTRGLVLGSPLPPTDPSGAMLIRNGQASIEVTHLDDAVGRLRQTATQLGGFVANTAIVGGREEHRSAQLEIRVPSAQFDAAVAALGSLGKVESVSATVQDAGEEYVDLSARAANARHMEARLVEMLEHRTGKLSDALTVEQELRRVREEIERFDARLKFLERKAALSSLVIALHEPLSVLDQRGPSPIAEAFAEAWRRAVGVVAWCIALLGVLVPLGLLVGGLILVGRRIPGVKRVTGSA